MTCKRNVYIENHFSLYAKNIQDLLVTLILLSSTSCREKVCDKYILLTKREGRTGRTSARGLDTEYRPSAARFVQKRQRADILLVRSRASLVNKRFIIRLKKALKVFHKFHVTLCGKCYFARTRCFHRWSWFTIIRRAFENF